MTRVAQERETKTQREARVRDEIYSSWMKNDKLYASLLVERAQAVAVGDAAQAQSITLMLEDLDASARRFATLTARDQVWGKLAPLVALFSRPRPSTASRP